MLQTSNLSHPQQIGPIGTIERNEGTSQLSFQLQVRNNGNAPGFARIEVHNLSTGAIHVGSSTQVSPESVAEVATALSIGSLAPDNYNMQLAVQETDGTNPVELLDSEGWTLAILNLDRFVEHDLGIDGAQASPTSVSGGDTLTVTFQVRNSLDKRGIVVARAFWLDTGCMPIGRRFGDVLETVLEAHTTMDFIFSDVIPSGGPAGWTGNLGMGLDLTNDQGGFINSRSFCGIVQVLG